MNPNLVVFLNLVRFGGAMLVLFGHARLHTVGDVDFGSVSESSYLVATSLAHQGVILFFVISGFLVGGKLYKADQPFFIQNYAIDRISRIYMVAVPAIVLAFILTQYAYVQYGISLKLKGDACARPSVLDLLGALAFLQAQFGVNTCFNSPLWSLVYEVFYYAFFGMLAVAWKRRGSRIGVVCFVGALLVGASSILEPRSLWAYSSLWLLGAALAAPRLFTVRGFAVVGLALIGVAVLCFQPGNVKTYMEIMCAVFLTLAITAFRAKSFEVPGAISGFVAGGAAFSYSLYLTHAPVMNLMRTYVEMNGLGPWGELGFTPIGVAMWALNCAVGLVAGAIVYFLAERHTLRVRNWLKAKAPHLYEDVDPIIPETPGDIQRRSTSAA